MLTVKEADANWPDLLELARSGEVVMIERADKRRVRMSVVVEPPPGLSDDEWVDWWAARAVPVAPNADDSVALIRRLRGYDD